VILFFFCCSEIPSGRSLLLKIDTSACHGTETEVNYLEHVQAVITANSTRRGDLEMFLTSPMGTRYIMRTT
jgi:proprotein convertase subtilisin/kexin type 2